MLKSPFVNPNRGGRIVQYIPEAAASSRTHPGITREPAASISARTFTTFAILCSSIILSMLPGQAIAQNAIDSDLFAAALLLQPSANIQEQNWNWHIQNTDIVQGAPAFSARYSGAKSTLGLNHRP